MLACLLAFVIQLSGVTGNGLRARAYFDANNVKVGDPMVLTIEFLGEADFKDLHPPALAKAVDRGDWKLDDASAKTSTDTRRVRNFFETREVAVARSLAYRVRPMREGVLWFPALEFEYAGPDGEKRIARANEIPVHAKGGAQVVVAEMGEDTNKMPSPPELVGELKTDPGVSEDDLFRWKKALSKPTADAFAEFDFPEARMNEATCAIREGNWARAVKIYRKLEWITGQTPGIERGIVAALALRYDNPAVELPVWRQVLRPLLRFGWKGRIGLVVGGFLLVALVFWLLGRGIKAVACVAIAVGCCIAADAQDAFRMIEEMERMHNQMMQQAFGGGGIGRPFEKIERKPVVIKASVTTDRKTLQVGEPFEFIVSLEYPRTASVGEIQMTPSASFGLQFVGRPANLTDGRSFDTNNVVKRLSIPARYDVPYRGRVAFTVEGMVSGRQRPGRGFGFISFSNSFRADTNPLAIDVKPLATAGQPADFQGIVSEGLRVFEYPDILRVETNDVVTITYKVMPNGYVPDDFLPKGAAFEWGRQKDRDGRLQILYQRYFVADGSAKTPELEIPYYDPRTKSYKTAKAGGTELRYVKER